MEQSKSSNQIIFDPVCLMEVAPSKKNLTVTYQMRTYYFCAESCLTSFKVNPEKYLEPMTIKRKGWLRRYLDRLNRATSGKPPQCH